MVLLLDNYDSFTYNLRDYILQCGQECQVMRNDETDIDAITRTGYSSIVISPGPKTPADAGITLEVIDAFHHSLPILGICLGHQAIGQYFGATLQKAIKPMHGKTSAIHTSAHFLFDGLPRQMDVMRYHSLILTDIESTPLNCIAETNEKEVMAVCHPRLPLAGLQFHPESILTTHGLQMMRNWFKGIAYL